MRHEPFSDAELTRNDFLGGRVRVWQPSSGYRAGIDPVLLAASVPAKPGQDVLELGAGGGVGLLCLGARVAGLRLTGVELQHGYAELARKNAVENRQALQIFEADLQTLPSEVRQMRFDQVFANPPYFGTKGRKGSQDAGRERGLSGPLPLQAWVEVAAKRTKPKGGVTMICRIEGLGAILAGFETHLGSIIVLPIAARKGREAGLFLIHGRKEGRAGLRMLSPMIVHQSARHERDAEDYTSEIKDILRDGGGLPVFA